MLTTLTLAVLSTAGAQGRSGPCSDSWINGAFVDVFGRLPGSAECSVNRYGGGSWSSYEDLKAKVMHAAVCPDPWVGQAVFEVTRRRAQGNECNINLYGAWSSYPDLRSKVQRALSTPQGLSTSEARSRVQQSYQTALQRQPTESEYGYWVPQTISQNLSVDALARAHAEWGAQQTYGQVLGRGASASEARAYADAALRGASSIDRLWSELMTSEEYRRRNGGRNGPANSAYVQYAKDARFNTSGQNIAVPEQCYGAIGVKCAGVSWMLGSEAKWSRGPTRADGVEMGYVTIGVSVGSIVHDNACRNIGVSGVWCNGQTLWDETLGRLGAATSEWKKAVFASMPTNRRYWDEKFGPYPMNNAALMARYTDDLTPVARRDTLLPVPGTELILLGTGVPALATMPVMLNPYAFDETRETRRLAAPSGQALDTPDVQFCASGQFQGLVQVAGTWGTCK